MNIIDLKMKLKTISDVMNQNKQYLVELDQFNGDGDLGISMSAGFGAVNDYLHSRCCKKMLYGPGLKR